MVFVTAGHVPGSVDQSEFGKKMEQAQESRVSTYRPLRVWIPAVLVPSMLLARYFTVWFPEIPMVWMVGSFVPGLLGIAIMFWWVLFSRATWVERLVGLVGVNLGLVITAFLMDKTMLGPPLVVLTIPTALAAFAVALILMGRWLTCRRTVVAVLCSFLVANFSSLLKNDGATGDFAFGFTWRWQPTPEDRFLAAREGRSLGSGQRMPTSGGFQNAAWSGFRGSDRDGVQRGIVFSADWKGQPPQELWRVLVGPAWSSFAVADSFLLTQEQRGDFEAIVCYDADSGAEVWSREIESRFFDALGGLGPRATPTIAAGSVFALGAEGWLVKLAAEDGEIQWQVDLRELTKLPPPMWGNSCSPLVVGDLVIVHAAGPDDRGVIAFDVDSGDVRWSVPADKDSYSSLHLTKFFDEEQLVFVGGDGVTFFNPQTGGKIHAHEFKTPGYRALQPAVVGANQLLFTSEVSGSRLIELQRTEGGWESTEVWTSRGIKPDFNDFVVFESNVFGFDGSIFVCIDLQDGSRRWKDGRYGKGQVILLADSGLLVVVSEKGDLVLVEANPSEHRELHKLKALDGKTWNHPVIVGNRLYVRNASEAVCYELPQK